jgi:hypothetical protein
MLRKHGAGIDSMAGMRLPIRYEAMREECNRHPAGDELFWRISLIDGEYLEWQEKEREQKDSRKGKR